MFSLTRLPVRQPMFLFSKNIIFECEIAPFVFHVWLRNRPEIAVTKTQKNIQNQLHNIDRNMADVVYNQSSRCFSKNLFDNISTGTIGFSVGPIGIKWLPLYFTRESLRASGDHCTMQPLTGILQHKGVKLRQNAVDTLGNTQKKESGYLTASLVRENIRSSSKENEFI